MTALDPLQSALADIMSEKFTNPTTDPKWVIDAIERYNTARQNWLRENVETYPQRDPQTPA